MPPRVDDVLSQRLASLPSVDGGEQGWPAVQEKLRRRAARRGQAGRVARWSMAASIAVLVAFVALSLSQPSATRVSVAAAVAPKLTAAEVRQLRAQSVALEQVLETLPARPAVARGGMALPIDTLEAQVQWLDHQLSGGAAAGNPADEAQLWRERVETMNSLVRLRYAEAQQIAM